MACGVFLPSVPWLGCRRCGENLGRAQVEAPAGFTLPSCDETGEDQEGEDTTGPDWQKNVDAVTQHAVRRHKQRLKARGRREYVGLSQCRERGGIGLR